jgi:hypothetical protein
MYLYLENWIHLLGQESVGEYLIHIRCGHGKVSNAIVR